MAQQGSDNTIKAINLLNKNSWKMKLNFTEIKTIFDLSVGGLPGLYVEVQ